MADDFIGLLVFISMLIIIGRVFGGKSKVKVILLDSSTKSPIPDVKVRLISKESGSSEYVGIADLYGKVEFKDIKKEKYTIICNVEGYEKTKIIYDFSEDDSRTVFLHKTKIKEIKPESKGEKSSKTAGLIVKILDNVDSPLTDTKVTVGSHTSTTDESGEVTLENLNVGKHEIKVEHEDFEPKTQSATIKEGDDNSVEIKLTHLPGKGNLILNVKNSITSAPVQNAEVTINEVSLNTDQNGTCRLDDLVVDEYEINVKADMFESATQKHPLIEDQDNTVDILIKPTLSMSEGNRAKLDELQTMLNECHKNMPIPCDMALPTYYKSIGQSVTNMIREVSNNPSYFQGSQEKYDQVLGNLTEGAETLCKHVQDVMNERKNMDIYRASSLTEVEGCEASPIDIKSKILPYINDFSSYADSQQGALGSRLSAVDSEITQKMSTCSTIRPASNLWDKCKVLMDEASSASDTIKKATPLLFADILLDHTQGMLNNAEVMKRLEGVSRI